MSAPCGLGKNAFETTLVPNVSRLKLKSPLFAQFEVTSACNYRCIFCYNVWKETQQPKDLDFKDKARVVQKLIDAEVFSLIFSGGEPLMEKRLPKLVELASKANVHTDVITNGALLTREFAEALHSSGLGGFQVSIHSPTNNDAITGVTRSLEKSLAGLDNALNTFGEKSINVNMVVTKDNRHEITQMAELLSSHGVKSFSIGNFAYTGAAKNKKSLGIAKEQFAEICSTLRKIRSELGMDTSITGGFPICAADKVDDELFDMIANVCDAGLNQLVVDPQGYLRPCVEYKERVGNILTDNLADVWNKSPFLCKLQNFEHVPKECYSCKHVSTCKGGCRASARSFFGKLDSPSPIMGEPL